MPYSQRFEDALVYATRIHANQVRKGGPPYIIHLLGVAAIAAEYGGDEDQVIGALLHDAAEDQGGRPRLEEIRARFGDAVAGIVEGCTDTFDNPKPAWRERKEAYIRHLQAAPAATLLVSASDKLYNARAIVADLRREGPACFEKFSGGRDGVLWYYGALVDAFGRRGGGELVNTLGGGGPAESVDQSGGSKRAELFDELAGVVAEMRSLGGANGAGDGGRDSGAQR